MTSQDVANATVNATKLAKIRNGKAKEAKERRINEKLEEAELGDEGNDVLPDAAASSHSLQPRTAPGRTDMTILSLLVYILSPLNAVQAVNSDLFCPKADHILVAGILASLGKVAKVAADAVIAVRIRSAHSLSLQHFCIFWGVSWTMKLTSEQKCLILTMVLFSLFF